MKPTVSSVATLVIAVAAVTSLTTSTVQAFTPAKSSNSRVVSQLYSADTTATKPSTSSDKSKKPETQQLGLLTFDLDDTLYPIQKVAEEANGMLCDVQGGVLLLSY